MTRGTNAVPLDSRSEYLKPLVLEVIKTLGGSVSGHTQSEIARTLQHEIGSVARRRINSALYKLVTDRILTCHTQRPAGCDGHELFTRTYRIV